MVIRLFKGTTESAEATPLGLKNVEGCFWVTIYGTILAGLFVIFEHLIYVLRFSRKAKISYFEAFTQELKFFFDFNSNVKPVVSRSSLDKSESEDDKTKSKSRSRSKSKSKSLKESQNSKSNGTVGSGFPYGFIISPSIERLDKAQ